MTAPTPTERRRIWSALFAGLTLALTVADVALLMLTKSAELYFFAGVALVIGELLTYFLLERAGLLGEGEQ